MENVKHGHFPFLLFATVLFLGGLPVAGQQPDAIDVPTQFKLDMETAARLRPQLMAASIPASGSYAIGSLVFDRLVQQLPAETRARFAWQVRLVEDDEDDPNAYASPDGTVYVGIGLAKLAGASAGLWAAILSHEMAHVVHRDWARRYLYQKKLENDGAANIVLGDPNTRSASWEDSQKASADMGQFCRQMEVEADREGLMMMARAGYHPDFVPALHHLLHAEGIDTKRASLYAMHPCWKERDRELSSAYMAASIEFARRWPGWYASPGGNPPVVVFAEEPTVKKTRSREWQIQIPLRCQNLAGAVEVVLSSGSAQAAHSQRLPEALDSDPDAPQDSRQLTGCTSPTTTVTFTLADSLVRQKPGAVWTEVYVLDAWGTVLARADLPKSPH